MLSGAQKARHPVLNTYSGGMVNIYAACRVSVGVMKSHVVLLCYKMAQFLLRAFHRFLCSARAVKPARTTLIFMLPVLKGVTNGHLVTQVPFTSVLGSR